MNVKLALAAQGVPMHKTTNKPALTTYDVHTLVQRKLILSTLRMQFRSFTTINEIEALHHAEEVIHNPVVFLALVEPWYRRMLEKHTRPL